MGTKSDTCGKRILPEKTKNHWSNGLLRAMKDPKLIVFEDELTVAIKDLWPKATFHYLICPKENISTLKDVKVKDLNLLKHMNEVGKKLTGEHKGKHFLLGYHAVPSMVHLHLHVISDDFDSPYLKTKKHWNSFTTEFFVPSEKVIEQLETKGEISHKSLNELKAFIDQSLKCCKCEYKPKNMPDLKHHIKTHS